MRNMTIFEFQEDLRAGMSLNDALLKHNLTLKSAMNHLHGYTRSKTKSEKTLPMYISKVGNIYQLKRKQRGKTIPYGTYKTLEDAMRIKAHMQEHGWYRNRLGRYRKELGIDSEEL